jgi:hypothetical protein
MWRMAVMIAIVLVSASSEAAAQRKKAAPKKAPLAPLQTDPAQVKCPEVLGAGVKTGKTYCFVLAGRDPAQGVLVSIPAHAGAATLLMNLHNRHTYSDEDVRGGHAFARYMAVVGVLGMDGTLFGRGAVQSEFRSAKDLYERITGGAGPGGVKAVAPIGNEQVIVSIPEGVQQVSLLGEVLDATTAAGRESATPGRPVAVISNVQVEYHPAPAPPARKR